MKKYEVYWYFDRITFCAILNNGLIEIGVAICNKKDKNKGWIGKAVAKWRALNFPVFTVGGLICNEKSKINSKALYCLLYFIANEYMKNPVSDIIEEIQKLPDHAYVEIILARKKPKLKWTQAQIEEAKNIPEAIKKREERQRKQSHGGRND